VALSLVAHIERANARYVAGFAHAALPARPARGWAILACMDARLRVADAAGLRVGDAHLVRNAGGLVTDDAIRSLVVSTHLLGTTELAIIQHTGCGMLGLDEDDVRARVAARTGADTSALRLHGFADLERNVREHVALLAGSPLLPSGLPVAGFVYEVESGRLRLVAEARTGTAE
jgi:carbonic anhydrase